MKSVMNLKTVASAVTLAVCTAAIADSVVDPHDQDDDTQITLSGKMVKIDGDEFVLRYLGGSITVELEDWARDAEELGFKNNAEVTVYGEIDNDLFTASTIEAEAVYLKSNGRYFYAPDKISKPATRAYRWSEPTDDSLADMSIRGRVIATDREVGEFTIAVANGDEITVKLDELAYDPFDEVEGKEIEKGDWVRVAGRLDFEFFEGKVLHADAVNTFTQVIPDPS